MKAAELFRELLWPASNAATLLALLGFFVLIKLAIAAGLLGIWLLVVTIPALSRYLLYLVEARSAGDEAPTPGIELFSLVGGWWGLLPVPLAGLFAWLDWQLASRGQVEAAVAATAVLLMTAPAITGVLAFTRSAIDALNPLLWVQFVRSAGWTYLRAPAGTLLAAILAELLTRSALPPFIGQLGWLYTVFLFFSLTGGIAAAGRNADVVAVEAPWSEPRPSDRRAVLNHAYGLVSRGNLDGGLRHVAGFLASSEQRAEDYRWFFEQMLGWEHRDAALFLAQDYLACLLAAGDDVSAVKLISRCLMLDPGFRPAASDRDEVSRVIERLGRDDVARLLAAKDG